METNNNNERFEKQQAGEIVIDSPMLKKADNFWFYNKWKVLISIFVVLVLGICIWQSCSKEGYDVMMIYAGPFESFPNNKIYNDIRSAFDTVIEDDFNNDGSKNCEIAALIIYSDEQMIQMKEEAAAESRKLVINTTANAQELQKFDQLIMAGEYSVCLLDPTLYRRVKAAGGFRPLSELFDSLPEGANDEYSILLSQTEFGKYFDVLDVLPPDTLLCLRTKSVMAIGKKADNRYEQSEAFFKAIVEFTTKEQ